MRKLIALAILFAMFLLPMVNLEAQQYSLTVLPKTAQGYAGQPMTITLQIKEYTGMYANFAGLVLVYVGSEVVFNDSMSIYFDYNKNPHEGSAQVSFRIPNLPPGSYPGKVILKYYDCVGGTCGYFKVAEDIFTLVVLKEQTVTEREETTIIQTQTLERTATVTQTLTETVTKTVERTVTQTTTQTLEKTITETKTAISTVTTTEEAYGGLTTGVVLGLIVGAALASAIFILKSRSKPKASIEELS